MSIIKRMLGEYTPFETRAESNESVNKEKRYKQILGILEGSGSDGMTAKEVAVEMHRRNYTPSAERNFSAPRLTELQKAGKVEAIGKTKCRYTGKTVAVYVIRNEE